jgi:hypothetical protein
MQTKRNKKLTKQAMPVHRYNETRFRNHYCRGKTINITYFDCVFVAFFYSACKALAPYSIVICGLTAPTTFSHIIPQTARFSGKPLSNVKYFNFLYNFN